MAGYQARESREEGATPVNQKSSLQRLSKMLPSYFGSEWSLAQFRVPDFRCIAAFGADPHTVVIVCANGSYYKARFDPVRGGEMVREEFAQFDDASSEANRGGPAPEPPTLPASRSMTPADFGAAAADESPRKSSSMPMSLPEESPTDAADRKGSSSMTPAAGKAGCVGNITSFFLNDEEAAAVAAKEERWRNAREREEASGTPTTLIGEGLAESSGAGPKVIHEEDEGEEDSPAAQDA